MRSSLLVFAFAAVAGCSTLTPTDDPVYLRLQDLDARLGRIEKVVNNQSLVDLASQIDQLQAETKELRGQIETLQHDTESASGRQRQLYLDVDRRLQALEQGQGRGAFSPSAGQGGFGQSAPAGAGPGTETGSQFANQPGAGAAGFDGAAGSTARGSGTAPPGASGAPTATDQESYQAAFNLIQGRKYPEAQQAFETFLTTYPQSALSGNAQYWLAETHYVQRDFAGALPAFQKVVDTYPQSSKIPDALLKVGYCNDELKQYDQARAALEKVMHDYPDTTAARLAQQRLGRIGQGAG
jgi:tol-pal system protein YbgF